MKHLLTLLLSFLTVASLSAQKQDTIRVCGLPFGYRPLEGWKQISEDSGLCVYDGTNLVFEMPFTEPTCGGQMLMAFSYVTDKEREERKDKTTPQMEEDILSDVSWRPVFGNFTVFGGSQETTSPRVTEIKGETIRKRKARLKRWEKNPIHNYSAWYYFPVNDTLEMLLLFNGRIPHNYESEIDRKMVAFSDYFFVSNDTLLDSLLKITDPYRFEPKTLPMDSLSILKTTLKYPLLPGWTYDTTRTFSEVKTTFLKIQSAHQTTCDKASISMNVRTTSKKPNKPGIEDLKAITDAALYKKFGYKAPPLDTGKLRRDRDSSFNAQEQHYYFTQVSSSEKSAYCNETDEISETISILIFSTPEEKIKITINFECTAEDYVARRDYIHAYYRFVILMIEANDFEKIYLNNKP